MKFAKMHGIGNAYILIDARDIQRDWAEVAKRICDLHFGIGSDGILLIEPSTQADYKMTIFNPDGSQAEACGNGIRMFTKYLVEKGYVPGDRQQVTVETLAGVGTMKVFKEDGIVTAVRASMGEPRLHPKEIPVALEEAIELVKDHELSVDGRTLKVTCVSMGNPHAVAFLEESVDDFPLHQIGPMVEHHPFFPKRVNFEIVNVLDRSHVKMRVWERGVGETLACGTGACAVAVASRLHDAADSPMEISLRGGTLTLEWDGEGEVFMTGPAEYICEGEWFEG